MDTSELAAPAAPTRKRSHSPDSSARESSSSESGDTSDSSRPQEKRRRRRKRSTSKESDLDRRFDSLSQQLVSYLNNILHANFAPKVTNACSQTIVAPSHTNIITPQDVASTLSRDIFLQPPNVPIIQSISEPVVSIKEPTIPKANPDRVAKIVALQRFDTTEWNSVRYVDIQKKYIAYPAFSELRVNEELRGLEDPFPPFRLNQIERSFAALSNAFLVQNEYVNSALQTLITFSSKSDVQLTSNSLYEKLIELFGNESKFTNVSQDILQIICGKRAEILESRRRSLLKNLKQKYTREDLDKIPPSSEYIFKPATLSEYISKIGGLDKLEKISTQTARQTRHTSPEPSTSNSFRNKSFRAQANKKKQFRNKEFRGRKDNHNTEKKRGGQKDKNSKRRGYQNK